MPACLYGEPGFGFLLGYSVLSLIDLQAALQEALSSAEEARQATADVGDVLCQVQSNQKVGHLVFA